MKKLNKEDLEKLNLFNEKKEVVVTNIYKYSVHNVEYVYSTKNIDVTEFTDTNNKMYGLLFKHDLEQYIADTHDELDEFMNELGLKYKHKLDFTISKEVKDIIKLNEEKPKIEEVINIELVNKTDFELKIYDAICLKELKKIYDKDTNTIFLINTNEILIKLDKNYLRINGFSNIEDVKFINNIINK